MPKRTRPHQLEDRSRTKFASLLPDAWVFRDKGKDYGIDGEVELFKDDGGSTGYMFYVQLKATDSAKAKDAFGVSIKLDTLAYYRSLDTPVLIARYVEKQDAFFIKWASVIDPYHAKRKGQKKLTVSFSPENRWLDTTPERIKTYLAKRRHIASNGLLSPVPMFIALEIDKFGGVAAPVWASALRLALKAYAGGIALEDKKDAALVTVTLRPDALVISAADQYGCVFDHPGRLAAKQNSAELVAEQVLLGLCVIHVQTGNPERAGQLIKTHNLTNVLLSTPGAALHILPPLFRTPWFEFAIEIAEALEATEKDPTLSLALHAAMLMRGNRPLPEQERAIEKALLRRVDTAVLQKDARTEAISRYNLGNYYRGRDQLRKAMREYVRARRVHDFYERQSYLFSEMGGILFDSGHFTCSLSAYKHALTLKNADLETKALCADAMMFAGKYQEAIELLRAYLSEKKEPDVEWILKLSTLEDAVEGFAKSEQHRQTREATRLADVTTFTDHQQAIQQLEQALQLDLLCGLAWFNLGNARAELRDYPAASFAYTFCAFIQRWDIEAWVHATLCCLPPKPVLKQLPIVIRVAYSIHEDKYLAALYARMERLGLPKSLAAGLAEAIQPILRGARKERVAHLRLPDEDGLMRPIQHYIKKGRPSDK